MLEVIAHEFAANGPQRFVRGRDLRQDIGAVAIVLDHFLQAADLPFDPPEPLEVASFGVGVDGHGFPAGCVEAVAAAADREGARLAGRVGERWRGGVGHPWHCRGSGGSTRTRAFGDSGIPRPPMSM